MLEFPILDENPPSDIRIPMKNSFSSKSKSCLSESEPCPNESESCPSESESGGDHYMRIPHTI